jgi:hypothetical protein
MLGRKMKEIMLCVTLTVCCSIMVGVYAGMQMRSVGWGMAMAFLPIAANGILAIVGWIESNA